MAVSAKVSNLSVDPTGLSQLILFFLCDIKLPLQTNSKSASTYNNFISSANLRPEHICIPINNLFVVSESRAKRNKGFSFKISCEIRYNKSTMKQEKQIQKKPRKTLVSLCAVSGLLLSVVCCIALVHVELRIQEHHRLLSHPTKFCDQIEEEILRKVQKNIKQWAAGIEEKSSTGNGKGSLRIYFPCFFRHAKHLVVEI